MRSHLKWLWSCQAVLPTNRGIQAGYEGLMRVKEEVGIEVAYSEKVAQPDQAEALAGYARLGFDVVAGHGGEFQEAANRVAKRYPDTIFIVHNGR